MTEATLSITNPEEILALFGARDQHLRKLRRLFDVSITQRDGRIRISGEGEDVQRATRTLERLRQLSRKKGELSAGDVDQAARRREQLQRELEAERRKQEEQQREIGLVEGRVLPDHHQIERLQVEIFPGLRPAEDRGRDRLEEDLGLRRPGGGHGHRHGPDLRDVHRIGGA